MADVRSMLRAERESRRITHPHASYTSTGTLSCNLCDVQIKSEKAWSAHLHSTEHNVRSGRPQATPTAHATTSRKRKAVEFDEPITERKKVRGSASDKYPTPDRDEPAQPDTADAPTTVEDIPTTIEQPVTPRKVEEEKDDKEEVNTAALDALERDLAEMEQQAIAEDKHSALTALSAAPTISASAVARGEEAAQDEDDSAAARRRKRDAENEEDREDAARALEEEFAEMDSLQERAKKLRDRREALRNGSAQPQGAAQLQNEPDAHSDDGEEDDADDDSEYDDWAFGAR